MPPRKRAATTKKTTGNIYSNWFQNYLNSFIIKATPAKRTRRTANQKEEEVEEEVEDEVEEEEEKEDDEAPIAKNSIAEKLKAADKKNKATRVHTTDKFLPGCSNYQVCNVWIIKGGTHFF